VIRLRALRKVGHNLKKIKTMENLKKFLIKYNAWNGEQSLSEITSLDLSHRGVRSLPKEIEFLTNLKSLNLKGNDLSCLPDEIGKLPLETLLLGDNFFSKIPSVIFQIVSLKTLDLNENNIKKLSKDIAVLVNLEVLYLSYNNLVFINDSIAKINLVQLVVWDNCFKTVPKVFEKLKTKGCEIWHSL
jgi:Leucine-rich repeat (LRR) protein